MSKIYTFSAKDMALNTTGKVSAKAPLVFSASPYDPDTGRPYGVIVNNRKLYKAVPDNLPAFVAYESGACEIRRKYDVSVMHSAKFIFSGSHMLIERGVRSVLPDERTAVDCKMRSFIPRMGVGILGKSYKVCMVYLEKATAYHLQEVMRTLGCSVAMMTALGETYHTFKPTSFEEGGTSVMPLTMVEAMNAKELTRPIIVLDPGHGGADPGACAFGYKETQFTLPACQVIRDTIMEKYNATVLLTRDSDIALSLGERGQMAKLIGADLFVSVHINAGGGTGFETYCHPEAGATAINLRSDVHFGLQQALTPHGFTDRGQKFANFQVLRDTTNAGIPSVLVEMAFIDTPSDLQNLLLVPEMFTKEATAIAGGIVTCMGLAPKPVTKESTQAPTRYFKVQVGAYQYRQGAEDVVAKLAQMGYDATIVEG